ncbi:MAG: hypothetical protein U5K28_12795 [Halobacteriales archaeon]|nr:hypothetical protein [Halobacteriales archaeon]
MSQSLGQLLEDRVGEDDDPLTAVARDLDDTSYERVRRAAKQEGIEVTRGGPQPATDPETDDWCVSAPKTQLVATRVSECAGVDTAEGLSAVPISSTAACHVF